MNESFQLVVDDGRKVKRPDGRKIKRAWNFEDLSGRQIGRLTVVQFIGHKIHGGGGKNAMWLCRCECGNEVNVSRCTFKKFFSQGSKPTDKWGCVPSCGCSHQEAMKNERPGYKFKNPRAPGTAGFNLLKKQYTGSAQARGFEWSLSNDEFVFLTKQRCHYCGVEPASVSRSAGRDRSQDYPYNGIDRKENASGYTKENSLSCCSICNWAKHTMAYDVFIGWLDRVVAYRHQLHLYPTHPPCAQVPDGA